jgi:hypothetical protein
MVVTDPAIISDFASHALIMLTDIGYWNNHWDELQQWCQNHQAQSQGMTVDIPDAATLTVFCLKWN